MDAERFENLRRQQLGRPLLSVVAEGFQSAFRLGAEGVSILRAVYTVLHIHGAKDAMGPRVRGRHRLLRFPGRRSNEGSR